VFSSFLNLMRRMDHFDWLMAMMVKVMVASRGASEC
jgi:hypothetical protein